MEWTQQAGDSYVVTGIDRNGKRFRRFCANWWIASSVNVWRGSKWLVRGGKRTLLCRVWN